MQERTLGSPFLFVSVLAFLVDRKAGVGAAWKFALLWFCLAFSFLGLHIL